MKFKRGFTGILSLAILAASTSTAFAASRDNLKLINYIKLIGKVVPISSEVKEEKQYNFKSFTGTIKTVTDFEGAKKDLKYVLVEDEEGREANIIVSKDTYIVNNENIGIGSVITGFYDANKPMIMIYPPQYNAEVVAVFSKHQNIKVDRFDKNLVSSDKSLKLNISKDTKIITEDGKTFKGNLSNKKLVVVYGVSTKSIPAQTAPTQIIVLSKKSA